MTDFDHLREIGRLRAALTRIRQMTRSADAAPMAAERWIDRIEDECAEALKPETKP